MIIASILRFANITFHDSYTDEVLYAIRSVELMDYVAATHQTTPWEWLSTVPWWGRLSYHDHPILFFLIEHVSIKAIGETIFAVRLPAVLTGIASVYLVYAIGKKLHSSRFGLIAGSIIAIQSYHVWVSRVGIQDGTALFFILLILWFWIQALDNKNKWYWFGWGTSLGLGILTKYTVGIIVPVLLLYSFVYKKKFHNIKWFWKGSLISFAITLPILIYNIQLYKLIGHFDFQFSALLNQETPNWKVRLGRDNVGSVMDRAKRFFTVLYYANSQIFNFLSVVSASLLGYFSIKNNNKFAIFLLSSLLATYIFILPIGSTYRFVTVALPWLVFIVALFFEYIVSKKKKLGIFLLFLFIFVELLFSINSFHLTQRYGSKYVAYAGTVVETQNYGFNQLNNYIGDTLKESVPAFFGQPNYEFLTKLQKERVESKKDTGYTPKNLMIIYDHRINTLARLWGLDRHSIYDGWPIMTDRKFYNITGNKLDEYFRNQGVESFIYISAVRPENYENNKVEIEQFDFQYKYSSDDTHNKIKERIESISHNIEIIKDSTGKDAFNIYLF